MVSGRLCSRPSQSCSAEAKVLSQAEGRLSGFCLPGVLLTTVIVQVTQGHFAGSPSIGIRCFEWAERGNSFTAVDFLKVHKSTYQVQDTILSSKREERAGGLGRRTQWWTDMGLVFKELRVGLEREYTANKANNSHYVFETPVVLQFSPSPSCWLGVTVGDTEIRKSAMCGSRGQN